MKRKVILIHLRIKGHVNSKVWGRDSVKIAFIKSSPRAVIAIKNTRKTSQLFKLRSFVRRKIANQMKWPAQTYPFPHSINFSFSSCFFLSSSRFFASSTLKSRFLPVLSRCIVSAPLPVVLELILANISSSLRLVRSFSCLSSAAECRPAFRSNHKII